MAIDDNTSYELTGAQVKDLASKINSKADASSVPTVNNATLTITQNGTSAGTFTANSATDATIALTDTTYSAFTGTDGTAAGTAGLVPAPAATDANKYLKSDGTWTTVSGGSSHEIRIELDDYLPNNTNPGSVEVVKNSLSQAEYDSLIGTITSGDSIVLYHLDSNDGYAEWYYIDDVVDNTTYLTLHISSTYSNTGGTALCGYDNIYVYPPSNDYPNGQISAACFPLRSSWFAGTDVYYGTSSTTSTTSTKVVTTTSNFKLEEGVVLFVYFTYQNSQTTLKLNVNSLGAKTVYANGSSTGNNDTMWKANDVVCFVYNGSNWRMLDADRATTAYYGKVKLASSYTSSSSDTVPTSSQLYSVYTIANGKQDQLYAGQGISINGNTISATGGNAYTYSGAVDTTNNKFTTTLTDQNSSVQNVVLNAGTGITFSTTTALGAVGPTVVPNTTAAYYADISGLTFTPTNANLGYFFVLRVYREYQMATSTYMYQATLYMSNTTYSYSSEAEVTAAISNEQIIVNPDFMAFSNYFTQINQSSFQSDAATAISQVSGVPANFGGTITDFGQATYVDVYVYTTNLSSNVISATGGGGASAITYYMTSGTTQGIPSYQTYIYSDAARTTVVDPDTILAAYEAGNTILLKYESTQTGSSAYDMTLQVNTMSLVGEDGYKMLVSELNADNGTYNAVNTVFNTTWDGTGTFSGRWVLTRNVYDKNALIIREWS